MLACRRLKICSCSSLGTLDNYMTWKNRPFIATNFLVVCILSLQYFAQNMTLAKTEKKKKKKKKRVYNRTRPSRLRVTRAAGARRGGGERGGDGKGKGRKTLAFLLPIAPLAPLRRDRERRLGMSQLTKWSTSYFSSDIKSKRWGVNL